MEVEYFEVFLFYSGNISQIHVRNQWHEKILSSKSDVEDDQVESEENESNMRYWSTTCSDAEEDFWVDMTVHVLLEYVFRM